MKFESSEIATIPVRNANVLGGLRRALVWTRKNAIVSASTLVVLVVLCVAVLAPVVTTHDPARQKLDSRLLPPCWQGGDRTHPLGTDHLGRDVWSRLSYGARITIVVALASVVGAGVLGTLLGLISGYAGGVIEFFVMGFVDAQLALPFVLLAIAIVAALGPGLTNIVLVLIISTWVVYARMVRSIVLSVKSREFMIAARMIGATHFRMIFRHILPNSIGPIVVVASLQVAQIAVAEAALSFLGLGIQPPTPSWGNMISDGRVYINSAWWLVTLPGLAITITVIAVNYVGDWLRMNLDPRIRRRGI